MKHWTLALGIILFAGCAHFVPQPLSPDKTAAELDARRLDDAGLKKFLEQNSGHAITAWPKTQWDFRELTLVAFYFHPDLEVARAQWLVAQGGLKTAGARPNPSVSLSPSYDNQIPFNYSPWLIPVTFDMPLETAGKRSKRLAEAEQVEESARYAFINAAWQVRSGVRSSLLEFTLAGRRAGLLQNEFSEQKEIVKLLQQRLDAGEISRPELTLAEIALHRTQLDLSDAEARKSDARSHLAEALGVTEAALAGEKLEPDFSRPEIRQLTSAEARQAALRSRADILGALADYAAAEADLRLEIAKQYPDLQAGPAYAWNNGNAGDNQWGLGATLTLPVLDQNQGPIAEAEARRALAAAKFVALQAQVIGEIDRAVAGFRVAREQWQTGNELLTSEQRQQKSAEAQIQAGASDRLDGLNAELELSNAELGRLDNEARLQTAQAALEDALQLPADSLSAVIEKISMESPNAKERQR